MFLDTRKYEYTLLVSCIIHNLKHQTYTTGHNIFPSLKGKDSVNAGIDSERYGGTKAHIALEYFQI
jgi:hypothetical protein